MHRSIETIRRDIQIANLTAEILGLRAEVGILRANNLAHDMLEQQRSTVEQRDAFIAELAAAREAQAPPPPATAPSGEPLRVDAPVEATGA